MTTQESPQWFQSGLFEGEPLKTAGRGLQQLAIGFLACAALFLALFLGAIVSGLVSVSPKEDHHHGGHDHHNGYEGQRFEVVDGSDDGGVHLFGIYRDKQTGREYMVNVHGGLLEVDTSRKRIGSSGSTGDLPSGKAGSIGESPGGK